MCAVAPHTDDPGLVPFQTPYPPRLSALTADLLALEASGRYTNFGSIEQQFRRRIVTDLFGTGAVATVCNATLGLVLAIAQALHRAPWHANERARRRYALVPAFTFSATIHALLWNRLTPLFVDIDPDTWLPSADAEERLLAAYADEIAIVLPYATFGNPLDLDRYADLQQRRRLPVVVDAAASLGSRDDKGRPFGAGSPCSIVFSMHATKVFATGEAGLVYSADEARIADIRAMSNFGHDAHHTAVMPGLNAKLSEVAALLCLRRLDGFDGLASRRAELAACYAAALDGWNLQRQTGRRVPYQFYPVCIPGMTSGQRAAVVAAMRAEHLVEVAHYFSPHAAEHQHFRGLGPKTSLDVTAGVARGIVSLPLNDRMTPEAVRAVAGALKAAVGSVRAAALSDQASTR
jgi:dTDP-4-amino-4,6-dideoxygalactose transaminase